MKSRLFKAIVLAGSSIGAGCETHPLPYPAEGIDLARPAQPDLRQWWDLIDMAVEIRDWALPDDPWWENIDVSFEGEDQWWNFIDAGQGEFDLQAPPEDLAVADLAAARDLAVRDLATPPDLAVRDLAPRDGGTTPDLAVPRDGGAAPDLVPLRDAAIDLARKGG